MYLPLPLRAGHQCDPGPNLGREAEPAVAVPRETESRRGRLGQGSHLQW